MGTLCDSHGHVQMLPPAELHDVLSRAEQAGVGRVLIPGTTVEDSRRAVELADGDDRLFAAVGVHPHETGGFDPDRDLKILEDLLASRKTVAVGEIGLDFHYDHSSREAQLAGFRSQLEFARERSLPVLLHNRESGAAMLEILEASGRRENAGVFHSFTEDSDFGLRAIGLGYKISYSGMLTFKGADNIRQSAPRTAAVRNAGRNGLSVSGARSPPGKAVRARLRRRNRPKARGRERGGARGDRGGDNVELREALRSTMSRPEDIFRQMFERNRAVQLLPDPETGRILDANPAACEYYGYSRED